MHGAPPNCLLPGLWLRRSDPGVARVIVAGSRGITQRKSSSDVCIFGSFELMPPREGGG
jgi:hypothetical protein